MIELSVHLLTFNNENHIDSTLQSILKQKVDFDFEIVVGDDCSTDNTFNIIKSHSLNHPNLFNIKQNASQLGLLANFKATLDRCKGNYVFDLAGDDMLKHDHSLQRLVNAFRDGGDLGFVDSGYDTFYEKENRTKHFSNRKLLNSSKARYKVQLILGKFTPIGICFNRKLLYQFVDFNTYLKMKLKVDDYPIMVDMASNTNFATIKESLHVYRVHDRSFSHQKRFERHYSQKNHIRELFNYFSEKYNFSEVIVNTYFENYHKELLFLAGYFEKRSLDKICIKILSPKVLRTIYIIGPVKILCSES